jgi:molybdate transport system regulatory protein
MTAPDSRLKISIRILCGDEIAMGPGKADLLDAIARTGSISGAGRAMGMSYRRAWLLVDAMNRCWAHPLVETMAGGAARSGAQLSATGRAVLAQYRALQAGASAVGQGADWTALQSALRSAPHQR